MYTSPNFSKLNILQHGERRYNKVILQQQEYISKRDITLNNS